LSTAAAEDPEDLLPQLACVVMRESTVVRDNIVHKYEFDQEMAARLFGKRGLPSSTYSPKAAPFPASRRVAALETPCGSALK
jgi:hypothetical protein